VSTTELPGLSPAQRQVAGVLAEVHDATILEITASAGVSKSTVTKALALLESAGAAARTIHTDGDVRFADTWSPTPLTGQLLVGSGPFDVPREGHAQELLIVMVDEPATAVEAESTEAMPEEEMDIPVVGEPNAHPIAAAVVIAEAEAGGRLASGGLAKLVADVLADNPFNEYTPTMLSHLLEDRSSGAISNALERQVKNGTAIRVSDKPRRYRHAAAQPDA
jgi:DNA-binding MarR family transcriptional regulator